MTINKNSNLITKILPVTVMVKVMEESAKEGVELSREEIVKRSDELLKKYMKDLGLE